MKTKGILYTKKDGSQELIISRANHDYIMSSDGEVGMDGGQGKYNRFIGVCSFSKIIWFDYVNVTHADLFNDWNRKKDKLGIVKLPSKKIRFLAENEIPDTDSFEWAVETAIWGTNGPRGDQPTKYIHLKGAETDHLEAILATQHHISTQTKLIIQHILKNRTASN